MYLYDLTSQSKNSTMGSRSVSFTLGQQKPLDSPKMQFLLRPKGGTAYHTSYAPEFPVSESRKLPTSMAI